MEDKGRVELVTVPKENGMTEYFLEFNPPFAISVSKKVHILPLHIEAYTKPCNEVERMFNRNVETIAEEIRCFRYIQVVSRDYSFVSMNRDVDVIAYLEANEPYGNKQCHAAIKSFRLFCHNKCSFGELSVAYLTAYRSFLLNSKKTGGRNRYSINSASSYLKHIKRILKVAFADRLIDFDPAGTVQGITWDHSPKKDRLTDAEIDAVRQVPFKDKAVKTAVLFSIYTGLRRSDILSLKWEDIEQSRERCYLCLTIQKTANKVRIPMTEEAVRTLGIISKRGSVFPTLSVSILNKKVPELMTAAGIEKHITFHCFRHTFAMRLLDRNVDIPTIAFLLGHKFIGSALSYLNCTKSHLEEVLSKMER